MDRDTEDAGTTEPTVESPEQAIARIREVRNRAETTLEWAVNHFKFGLLSIALDHLTLGRTYLAEAELRGVREGEAPAEPQAQPADQDGNDQDAGSAGASPSRDCVAIARKHLDESVRLLRQAGQQQYLPDGLLHRVALWRVLLAVGCDQRAGTGDRCAGAERLAETAGSGGSDTEPAPAHQSDSDDAPLVTPYGSLDELVAKAERDLTEAESIAERGSMLIWRIEAALERTRLFLTLHHAGWEGEAPAEPQAQPVGQSGNDQTPAQDGGSAGASPSRCADSATRWLARAREKLEETRRLVKETESKYEPHFPDWDEWQPPDYVGVFKQGDTVGYHRRNGEIERLQAAIELGTERDRGEACE